MPKALPDETLSVRLPAGLKAELRAASGQNPSTMVRWMIQGFLDRKRQERAKVPLLQSQAREAMDLGASFDTTSPGVQPNDRPASHD